jgi:hypothetical protein
MMRTLIAIVALVFLVSCADTPSKPTSTGGSSSGSGKVVTATSEDPYECDGDLILEPHLPEECIPPEPPEPVVQKPVEPPKPDPIVGAYRCHNFLEQDGGLLRVYPNNKVDPDSMGVLTMWKKDGESYNFYLRGQVYNPNKKKYVRVPPIRAFIATYSDAEGEPNLTAVNWEAQYPDLEFNDYNANGPMENPSYAVECIKRSSDPDDLFDAYELRTESPRKGQPPPDPNAWVCINKGRKDKRVGNRFLYKVNLWSDSLAGCEAICEEHVRGRKDYTCPQDRR